MFVAFSMTPGTATAVSAVFGSTTLGIEIPTGQSLARVVVSNSSTAPELRPSISGQRTVSDPVVVMAAGEAGQSNVSWLSSPAKISITFHGDGVDTQLAQMYTYVDDQLQPLVTVIVDNGDGTFTAVAQTNAMSMYFVGAPGVDAPTNHTR